MHSLSLLMSTEHPRDLQRQAAKARLAKAARRSTPAEEDSVSSSPSKRPFLHGLMSLLRTRRHPEEARWS
ncbi:MAG TPA: hypothetical protein VFF07_03795 [Actinomycetota bacterium]|nr:hypothetical protein [Actinomycetota bacterium]